MADRTNDRDTFQGEEDDVPHNAPMTAGEIARSLLRIEKSMDGFGQKLDNRPSWEDVRRIEHGLDDKITNIETHLARRVGGLESWQTWAQRLVLGLVAAAVIALVIGTGNAM